MDMVTPLQNIWRASLASWRPLKNGNSFKYLHISRSILSNGLERNSMDVKTPFSGHSGASEVNIAAMEAGVTKYYRNRNYYWDFFNILLCFLLFRIL